MYLRKWIWPTREQRKRLLRVELIAAIVIMYGSLAVAHIPYSSDWARSSAGSHIDYALFYVRVFQFHLGLAMLACMGVALLLRWWKLAAATVPFVVFTLEPAVVSYIPRTESPSVAHGFTLVTCNLLYINPRIEELAKRIEALQPDVVCLQELTPKLDVVLRRELGNKYRFVATIPQLDAFGVGVYSRLPFAGPSGEAIPNRDLVPQQRVFLDVNGTTVSLFNMHLFPPGSIQDFYDMNWQIGELRSAIKQEPGPLVVVGDFNSPRGTRQSDALEKAGLQDAYAMSGTGRGSTWPALPPLNFMPGLALDHVYLNGHLRCSWIKVFDAPGSDHRLMVAKLDVK